MAKTANLAAADPTLRKEREGWGTRRFYSRCAEKHWKGFIIGPRTLRRTWGTRPIHLTVWWFPRYMRVLVRRLGNIVTMKHPILWDDKRNRDQAWV